MSVVSDEKVIVYDSYGGTTKDIAQRVANRIGIKVYSIKEFNEMKEKHNSIILFTFTYKLGKVPETTECFLNSLKQNQLCAVVSNGSKDFEKINKFGVAGDIISEKYNVPLLRKLDNGGSEVDEHALVKMISKMLNLELKKVSYKPSKSLYQDGIIQLRRRR